MISKMWFNCVPLLALLLLCLGSITPGIGSNVDRGESDLQQQHTTGENICSICLDDMIKVGEKVGTIKCGHIFHFRCLVRALQL